MIEPFIRLRTAWLFPWPGSGADTSLGRTFFCLVLAGLVTPLLPQSVHAWNWVPSDEEIQKYRQIWNPLTHGPILVTIADTLPRGQLYVRPFIYSQISEHQYGNQFTFASQRRSGQAHLYSVQHPYLQFGYGLTNHIQLGGATSVNSFWAKDSDGFNRGQGGPWKTNTGLGDSSLYFKYRPMSKIQRPCARL